MIRIQKRQWGKGSGAGLRDWNVELDETGLEIPQVSSA